MIIIISGDLKRVKPASSSSLDFISPAMGIGQELSASTHMY